MQKELRPVEFRYKPISPNTFFTKAKLLLTAPGPLFHLETSNAKCSSFVGPALEFWVGRGPIVLHALCIVEVIGCPPLAQTRFAALSVSCPITHDSLTAHHGRYLMVWKVRKHKVRLLMMLCLYSYYLRWISLSVSGGDTISHPGSLFVDWYLDPTIFRRCLTQVSQQVQQKFPRHLVPMFAMARNHSHILKSLKTLISFIFFS